MVKRGIALFLSAVLLWGLLACQHIPEEPTAGTESFAGQRSENLYFEDPLVIELVRPVNTFSPGNDYIIGLFKQLLNVEIQLTELSDLDTQYERMLTENRLPAITWMNAFVYGNEYGPQGAYVDIMEYLEQMPNLNAVLESNPQYVANWSNADGSLYHIPCVFANGYPATYGFLYREDIFEKHQMSWPASREEFEALLRRLKKLYPESYPMVVRGLGGPHVSLLTDWGVAFGAKLLFSGRDGAFANYDSQTGKWYEGATAEEMREMVAWLKGMMEEGLIYAGAGTLTTAQWHTFLNSGAAFISWEKMDRLPYINAEGVKTNADFSMVGATPIKMAENGYAGYLDSKEYSYSFLVSADAERLGDVLLFVDWLYSEEGIRTTNYGREGETYTMDASGVPVWSDTCKAEMQPQSARGLAVGGFYGVSDFNAYLSWQGERMQKTYETVNACATVENYYPKMIGLYTEEERMYMDTYGIAYQKFIKGELLKFLFGERNLSEWDAFAKEAATTYKGAEIVAITQAAWDRARAG